LPFTKSRYKEPDKMENVNYTEGPEPGCPILEAAAAYLECRGAGKLDVAGDHDLVVGEVVDGGVRKPGQAADSLTLVDLGWSYTG
jgi:flavin reductase (DIM6/NTAB) family NADH-FMN oxidoreductase RutF